MNQFVAVISHEEDESVNSVALVESSKTRQDFERDFQAAMIGADLDDGSFGLDSAIDALRTRGYNIQIQDYAHVTF